jgi:hypothetical protein
MQPKIIDIVSKLPTEWHERFAASSINMRIRDAFEEAVHCDFYDKMDNQSFLYGVLIASGLSASTAVQVIENTRFTEKTK